MEEFITLEQIDEAVATIRQRTKHEPLIGLILGSGLGSVAEAVQSPDSIPYPDLPHWPISTVIGHAGRLVIGQFEGHPVMVMQGRSHFYEGYSMGKITFPVRVMQRMGIKMLVVTNAAGAINPDYVPGDVMVLRDHIGLIGMTGNNPLRGPNLSELGERFPDMSQPYDRKLRALACQVAVENGIRSHEGVYVSLSGPSFESPADLRFLKAIGADAVGMSTVPEVIVARHGRTRVLGISGITNKANLDGSTETTHEEVLQAGKELGGRIEFIVRGVLRRMEPLA